MNQEKNNKVGILEQILETLNILVEKVEKLEASNADKELKRNPLEVMNVKKMCEELCISRAEFYKNYSNDPALIRSKHGGPFKCLRKDFEKFVNKKFGS